MNAIAQHPRLGPALVVAVSLGALATAFLAQYWGGLEPCVLCMWQRYVYGVAIALGLVGALAGRAGLTRAVLLLAGLTFLAGFGIAVFNVGVEQHWWRGTAGCHAPAFDMNQSLGDLRESLLGKKFVACDEIAWSLFGRDVLTIAAFNALASLLLAAAAFRMALPGRWPGSVTERTA